MTIRERKRERDMQKYRGTDRQGRDRHREIEKEITQRKTEAKTERQRGLQTENQRGTYIHIPTDKQIN